MIDEALLITRNVLKLFTLSSIVSNFVSKIPSISLGLGEVERSASFCSNKEHKNKH